MKLIKRPEQIIEYIDAAGYGGLQYRLTGKSSITDVEIEQLDFNNPKDKVWNRLKNGSNLDLRDAFDKQMKIDKLAFAEDRLILYGICPFELTRIQEGYVYKCKIEYFEVISTVG